MRTFGPAAVGALNGLVAAALLLYLVGGPMGLFLFLGTWPLIALAAAGLGVFCLEARR